MILSARPNKRMQSDAATRPQDRADFGMLLWLKRYLGLSVRRG